MIQIGSIYQILVVIIRLLAFSLILFVAGCSSKDPRDPNYVLAKGKGFKIVRSDLNGHAKEAREKIGLRLSGKESEDEIGHLEKIGLDQLVEAKVLHNEADRLGLIAEAESNAEKEKDAFYRRYSTDEQRERFFKTAGIDEKIFLARILDREILVLVQAKTGIQKPKKPFQKSLSQPSVSYVDSGALLVQEIGIIFQAKPGSPPISRDEAKKQIQILTDIWKKNGGTSWPESWESMKAAGIVREQYIHREYTPKNIPAEYKKTVQSLKPGGYSEIISGKEGFHVLHMVYLKDLVRQRLLDQAGKAEKSYQMQKDRWDAFIDELKKRYDVQITAQAGQS